VKEFQRKQLLERIERDGATVGASIPDQISVQGEEIALREFVFEIRRREAVPPAEEERVDRAKRNLRRERVERKQRIEDGDISFAEGERLAAAVIGLDRALTELETLEPVDIEAEADAQSTADRKRWLNFLKKATGRADSDHSGRGNRL